MANITQDSEFLSKNSSGPSREQHNLPSDEEFFGLLIDYRWVMPGSRVPLPLCWLFPTKRVTATGLARMVVQLDWTLLGLRLILASRTFCKSSAWSIKRVVARNDLRVKSLRSWEIFCGVWILATWIVDMIMVNSITPLRHDYVCCSHGFVTKSR